MTRLTGKEAKEFADAIAARNEKQRQEDLAHEKAEALRRGKEPFDLAKLEEMCDTTSEGRLDPLDVRQARFEYLYYVQHPELMTLKDLAAHIERTNKW